MPFHSRNPGLLFFLLGYRSMAGLFFPLEIDHLSLWHIESTDTLVAGPNRGSVSLGNRTCHLGGLFPGETSSSPFPEGLRLVYSDLTLSPSPYFTIRRGPFPPFKKSLSLLPRGLCDPLSCLYTHTGPNPAYGLGEERPKLQ